MYTMSAKIIGAEELKRAFKTAPEVVARELGHAIEKSSQDVANKARDLAPRDKGDLKRSIEAKPPVMTASNIYAIVSSDKNYARYQEEGTGIYGPKGTEIVPKNKPMLAWKKGGEWIFARKVKGVRPKWYMKQAKEQAMPILTDSMETAIKHILAHLKR